MKKQELIQTILENFTLYYDENKEILYNEFIIKAEEIKDEYFRNIEQNYSNLGYGDYVLSKKEKEIYVNMIITEQQKSFDKVIYFFQNNIISKYSKETQNWALSGILNLGRYNEETQKFEQRDKHTTDTYVNINSTYLLSIMDIVEQMPDKETILNNENSFEELYTKIINQNKTKDEDGKWIKYPKNSDYQIIINDIESYGTNWDILDEKTSRVQIAKGDMHIYYTKDEFGCYTIPRILIQTSEKEIEKIEGIAKNQNIEAILLDKVMDKLKEFPQEQSFIYLKKVFDMNLLTQIYEKTLNNLELTEEELRFLYEIDSKILTFSQKRDSRIMKIRRTRNTLKDLTQILKIEENEIGFIKSDLKNKNLKYYYGNLYIHQEDEKEFPHSIIGILDLSEEETMDGIILPEYVRDGVKLNDDKIYTLEELKQTKKQMKIYRK